MTPSPMVSPEQAKAEARRRLTAGHRRWTLEGWSPPVWTQSLRPPTERQVLADPAAAESWVRGWAAQPLPAGLEVDWEDRTWRSVGTQRVPVRLLARTPEDLARYVGGREDRDHRTFAERVGRIRGMAGEPDPGGPRPAGHAEVAEVAEAPGPTDPLTAVLRRNADRITHLPAPEFDRLLAVTAWLGAHPVTGLRPRQLPIRGVDSKWFSAHRTVVTALHGALFGGAGTAEGIRAGVGLGMVESDPAVRLRILDPSLHLAGLTDLQVPLTQAAGLDWQPGTVLIVENQETLLSLPPAHGVVALWGRGFDTAATALPWLRGRPILYWGDLDSHGFAILHRYRSHLPQIESVLMDEGTLEAFTDLWVPEPKPFRGTLATLTPAESRTLERLRGEGDVRLEQERVGWAHALERLAARVPLHPHPQRPA